MKDLRESLDRSMSGVGFRPEMKRRVLRAASEREMPAPRRRLSTVVVLALIAALILMGVAVAAVITRGFGWYATRIDDPAAQYSLNQLDERATVAGVQRTASGQGPVRFEVPQAYYDGRRIDVTYTLSAPDHFSDTAWRPTETELEAMQFYAQDNVPAFDDPGVNKQLESDFQEQGVCGLHLHSYRIGENLKVAGVPCSGWDSYDLEWIDGMTSRYQVLEQLPEEAQDRDSVEMVFDLTEYDLYYYQNQTGYYYRVVDKDSVPLDPVVVPRGKGKTVNSEASRTFESYTVYAKASVSPIEIQVFICQVLPDEWVVADAWTRGSDLHGVDYIEDYRLIADGAVLEGSLNSEGNGPGRISIGEMPETFQTSDPKKLYTLEIKAQGGPEGTKELRLRPVYSISGEHPEEDLVLEIPG